MKKEDKEILIKDICSRLPYGVFVEDSNGETAKLKINNNDLISMITDNVDERFCKPYLRTFYSITDSEIKEWMVMHFGKNRPEVQNLIDYKVRRYYTSCTVDISFFIKEEAEYEDYESRYSTIFRIDSDNCESIKFFDWLNAHHFDYRGLIQRGLAVEAPEGMY